MDSLHLTLDLYVTTLTYQQLAGNEATLADIKEKLTDLRQEVEHDLQLRTASATVNAAILTVQYNDFLITNVANPSRSTASNIIVEELTSENDDDGLDTTHRSPDQSRTLSNGRNIVISLNNTQPISPDVLDHAVVSNALVIFTQIQIVQKKTIRGVDHELQRRRLPVSPSAGSANIDSDGVDRHAANTSTPNHMRSRDGNSTHDNRAHRSSTQEVVRSGSLDPGIAIEPRTIHNRQSPAHNSLQIKQNDIGSVGAIVPQLIVLSDQQKKRFAIASRHANKCFQVQDIGGAYQSIAFLSLFKYTLSEIIIDMHGPELKRRPSILGNEQAPRSSEYYRPPELPLAAFNIYHDPQRATVGGNHSLYAKSVNGDPKDSFVQQHISPFVTYVFDYARWHTNQHRLKALTENEYCFVFAKHSELTRGCYTDRSPRIAIGEEYDHLEPGMLIAIEYTCRQLLAENAVILNLEPRGVNTIFASDGPYVNDLRLAAGFEGLTVKPWN